MMRLIFPNSKPSTRAITVGRRAPQPASPVEETRARCASLGLRARAVMALLALACLLAITLNCSAYSELTHEAIIDAAWDVALKPLLLKRFPDATPQQLKTAHAYAWGGSVIQDMGYYPFGSKLFTNLVHYVRTADFVDALLHDSQNINDYAFALGALAHYASDNDGHKLAVNVSEPILYPKLRKKYGNWVVYDENPADHLKTEFGFDVLQVARGRYASDDYEDYIGFQVAKPLLERAFQETYGLKLASVFSNLDLAIGTYRRGVSEIIPTMTRVAWQVKKSEIKKEIPGMTRKRFLYHISRSAYNRHWSKDYKRPSVLTRILAFLIRLIPKIGPFRALAFRTPTPRTEQYFMTSFNVALRDYERDLHNDAADGSPQISNDNLDTGSVTGPGQYPLADKTYAELLDRLAKNHFAGVTPQLRSDLLRFYSNPSAPIVTRKHKKKWRKVTQELAALKAFTPAAPTASVSP